MPITEQEKNRREAAAVLLADLNDPETPLARKIEIVESTIRANPESFIQVARIHLHATAYPKYQD